MGEFRVHHVKFCDYVPSAIQCIACDRDSGKPCDRLAVGREDGSVEIWSIKDKNWYQEKVVPGSEKRRVDSLAWVSGRLFSCGLQGDITEYNLKTCAPQKTVMYGSAFWCMKPNHSGTHLATGAEDGCVRLFEIDEEGVTFDRSLDPEECRVVTLAWHRSDEVIVTGSINTIRIWNVSTGHAIQRISMPKVSLRNMLTPPDTIVWHVAITSNYTIISGDSTGKTQFWNGRTGTLIKSFLSHKADVLTLCVSDDERSVCSAGVDPTIAQFHLVDKDGSSDTLTWVRSRNLSDRAHSLCHTHDIKALVFAWDQVVSGGTDTNLLVSPAEIEITQKSLKQQTTQIRRLIPALPQRSRVSCAPDAEFLLFQFPAHLEVWKLGSTLATEGSDGETLPLSTQQVKLLELKAKNGEHIACSAISSCGRWLAYSDVERVRMFHLNHSPLSLSKVPALPSSLHPAHLMAFTKTSEKLVLASHQGLIQVIQVDSIQPTVQHSFPPMEDSINQLSVTDNGKFIAAADNKGNIFVYNLDSRKLQCRLPGYKHQPCALAINPHTQHLTIVYTDRTIAEFDFIRKGFSAWTKRLHKVGHHEAWLSRRETITAVTFDPMGPDRMLLQDSQAFYVIDKKKPLPSRYEKLFNRGLGSPPQGESKQHGFSICQRYKPLLYAGYFGKPGWLVVVERPLEDIYESLPSTLPEKKFGT
ncbi:U3 small nucleolar RNA-associated protein 4 homolog [Acanthaster planci]|uniref:U3 small nucleolar RNA-associated protein 4 homolog n=1 Tax=Acanthaster planci TaxID=133434 RepID=A0A8B7YTS9_ACAPL|nr:U3 small nucleolar RNA-associated protein 4 homolog [Acanthaster planci]